MQITARNVLAVAALAAVAASAAAQDSNIITDIANNAADGFTSFFANLNDSLTSTLTSFA